MSQFPWVEPHLAGYQIRPRRRTTCRKHRERARLTPRTQSAMPCANFALTYKYRSFRGTEIPLIYGVLLDDPSGITRGQLG